MMSMGFCSAKRSAQRCPHRLSSLSMRLRHRRHTHAALEHSSGERYLPMATTSERSYMREQVCGNCYWYHSLKGSNTRQGEPLR